MSKIAFFLSIYLITTLFYLSGVGNSFNSPTVFAQSKDEVLVSDIEVDYAYGQNINIQANYQTEKKVESITLFLHPDGQNTEVIQLSVNNQDTIASNIDLDSYSFYPFTRIYYWFKWKFSDNSTFTSPSFWFDYEDNRFDWQRSDFGTFEIYWQNQDESFVQRVYNTAKTGLEAGLQVLNVDVPKPIKIIVYLTPYDVQSALQLTNQTWVAGHANPEKGMILLSIPDGPNQQLEIERQIPHELTHILEYQISGPSYTNQPAWLKEGLASSMELYPNPDYQRVLENASENKTLMDFSSLCDSFPKDTAAAFQAYAQSSSFIKYLQTLYGSSSLQELFLNYRNNLSCEEGFNKTYGISLLEAEKDWQKTTLGVDGNKVAIQNLSPYFLLSLVIIVPPIISGVWLFRRNKEGTIQE